MTTLRPEITGRASDKPKLPIRGFSQARAPPVADEEDIAAKVKTKPKPRMSAEPAAETNAQQQQLHQEARQAAEARARQAEEARQRAKRQAQSAHVEPLLVRPAEAWKMLRCGNTYGYELLNRGEIESFLDGRSRKIVVASIHRYIARRLAAAGEDKAAPQPHRRGRPRKTPVSPEAQP
jgi:hypothetical protein